MRSILLLIGCCLLVTHLLGQPKREELHDDLVEIAARKRLDLTYDFKAGEDILLTATEVNGKKIGKIVIDLPKSSLKLTAKKIANLENQRISVAKTGTYTFHFVNKNLFAKRKVNIKIYKQPTAVYRDSMVLDDIITSTRRDTIRKFVVDTIPIPDITSVDVKLSPSLNYAGISDTCIRTDLLLEDKYQYAVYWVGVGTESIRAYEKLKANPPPAWSIEGVNEPIMAFGQGLTSNLPTGRSSLMRNIRVRFVSPNSKKVTSLTKKDRSIPPYGVIPLSKASKYRKIMMCIKNFNTTTGIPVYIKIAKFRLARKYTNEIVVKERIQEIFIEKKIEIKE
ncbi:MAG: hypothetical protein GY810_24520 [Aureispira sp.]|nr:hypothetical protein [Aureispira sp.]